MSTIKTNAIQTVAGKPILNSTGSILQVVQGTLKTTVNIATDTYTSLGLSATITPSSTSNKILVMAVIHIGATGGNEGFHGRLYRNGSNITDAMGNAASTRDTGWFHCGAHYSSSEQYPATPIYLDSPASTSALTYAVYGRGYSSSYPININCSEGDADQSQQTRTMSTITLMEISS